MLLQRDKAVRNFKADVCEGTFFTIQKRSEESRPIGSDGHRKCFFVIIFSCGGRECWSSVSVCFSAVFVSLRISYGQTA
jgi:hypothetical protein